MGSLDEFKLPVRLFLNAYPWRRVDPVPWQPLRSPLNECRLALVSSAGLVGPEQEPFDPNVRGGDYSFRVLPTSVDLAGLIDTQRSDSYDHSGVALDPNLAFPLDRAKELVEQGRLGSLNDRHLSFMGSLTATGRLARDTAPEAAKLLVSDQVDVALLTPV